MKLVYTNENRVIVRNAENVLSNAGIPVTVKNEFAGGAMGELPMFDTQLELWVINDEDEDKARQILKRIEQPAGVEWSCPNCGEANGPAFDFCWKCTTAK